MPYDFFDLQQNVMDAQKIINSYYVIMQDYDDKITQIENETNEKISLSAGCLSGPDYYALYRQCRRSQFRRKHQ